jgi:branched-chain amino acid transport system ATP-binding protein
LRGGLAPAHPRAGAIPGPPVLDSSLEIVEVSVEFSGLRALDRVSLALAPAEILGLIGPNGSGKTTLVNAITGHVPVSGGQVLLRNARLSGLPPRLISRRGIARTFQIVRLFNNLTVRENVETAALAHGDGLRTAGEKADALLVEFGLSKRADDLGFSLSFGDKRRVEIARALAADPMFLLLDEPAAGMNEAETDVLLRNLAGLRHSRGLGLLIIDHDMGLIMRLCDRLHVLASGRTIAEGDAAAVRANPAVVEAYLGATAAHA